MNQRVAKKINRTIRKEAQKQVDYEMKFLQKIFKPKPKWVPGFIWRMGLRIYVREGEFDFNPDAGKS